MTTSRRSLLKRSAATVAAMSLDWTRAPAQAETIRIGTIYDLSGPFAAGGSVACSIGTQIAIDLVNEKGGVAGKYKVVPINADLPEQGRCGDQRGRAADQPGEGRHHQRRLRERACGAARRQGRGAEEDPLDHDGGLDRGVQGQEPAIRVPRARSIPTSTARPLPASSPRTPRPSSASSPRTSRSRSSTRTGPMASASPTPASGSAKENGPADRDEGRLFGHRARSLLAGHQAQARRRRCDLARRLQSRHHAVPAPGARERAAVQDAGRQRRRLQPARQAARDLRQRHRQFLQHRSGAGATARSRDARAGHRRSHQDHGRALQGQDQRHRRAAALLDGLQPDLGAAQQRAAGRQGEIRRLRSPRRCARPRSTSTFRPAAPSRATA